MPIRLYRQADAAALCDLFRSSVHTIGPRDYTPQQVAAWAKGASPESLHARLGDDRLVLVAEDETGALLAFGDLEADGHIDFLYAAPQAAGMGVASALYDVFESTARERGMARLYTEASEAARRFFLKKNFVLLQRRDFAIGEVPIHNYAMEKRLQAQKTGGPQRPPVP